MNTITCRTLGRTGFPVSEIGLGTTAIGYVYGIGPRELPSENEALTFLREMVDRGVNFIDTSPAYQLAEERIGKSGIARLPGVIVSTKCGHVLDRGDEISNEDLAHTMRLEVEASLVKLKLDCLELVQVHGGTAVRITDGSIIGPMQDLQKAGKVKFIGISVRDEESALAAIESGFFDTIQIAYSILDQRLAPRVFERAQEKNIGIINRSVLLKGALTPARKYLFAALASLKKNAEQAEKIAERLGIDLPTLAIRFSLSEPVVSTVIIGTNKSKHIENALAAASAGPLPPSVITELRELAVADPLQVDPRHWKKQATEEELATWSDSKTKK